MHIHLLQLGRIPYAGGLARVEGKAVKCLIANKEDVWTTPKRASN
jgi:hypothetical protein